jgi:CDP-glycerol glycerophosphotransferase
MVKHYDNKYEYIWCLNKNDLLPERYKNITVVKYLSLKYMYHIMTAGFIVENNPPEPIFPKRQNQVIINTTHGAGGGKKGGVGSLTTKKREFSLRIKRKIRAQMTNFVISSCKQSTHDYVHVFCIPEKKFLLIGMPRNDIFFIDTAQIKQKILDYYHIKENHKIVLYAPTYRGDPRSPDRFYTDLNMGELLQGLRKKFGYDFTVLYRGHHDYKTDEFTGIISATEYPDMQELLCTADILITDYSSCMWDFSFTYKPCFLYTPDLEKYRKECGFWTQPEEWPFPIAKTNEDLIRNILSFDNDSYITKVKKHHKDLGSYETGNAAENLYNYLFSKT